MSFPGSDSILDKILSGGIESVAEDMNDDPQPSTSQSSVSAVATGGNSLTFFVNSDMVTSDIEDDTNIDETSRDPTDEGVDGEEIQEGELTKERELTDQYLAGKLTFRDFINEIKQSDDEDEGEDDVGDEDWRPPRSVRSKTSRTPSLESLESKNAAKKSKESADKFKDEMEQTQKQQLTKKKRRMGQGLRKKRLDPALQGLMGEANLRFARGDVDTAVRMCMEVIRQDPTAPEPFQTLATLYEEEGEIEKSLQFSLIAAHLAPQDPEEWSRLADMSLEQGDLSQASTCYRKAVDADPSNPRYHNARASLLERMGEKKAALRCYKRLLVELKDGDGEQYLQGAVNIARLMDERNQKNEAQKVLEEAFDKHPDHVIPSDLNLLLEMLITLEQFQQALEVTCKWCGVQFSADKPSEDLTHLDAEDQLAAFADLIVPDDMICDIKSKLVVILVRLRALHLVTDLTEQILEQDADEFGDFMLEIAEAMMVEKMYPSALPFLEKLVTSQQFAQPLVWLQLGECLFNVNRLEEAEAAYKQVVELAPNHYNARLQLSAIVHKLGRPEDALLALQQDEQEMLNTAIMFERCQLLLAEGRKEQFVTKAKLLFSRHFVNIRNKDELHAISSAKKMSSKNKALSEVRSFRREALTELETPEFSAESDIKVENEFELFKKLCDILFEEERYDELQRMAFSALGSPLFAKKPEIHKECEFLCLLASFFNGDSYHAYNCVRELVLKDIKNESVWNMFNLVIMRADDVRHNRFLMRLMSRNPDNIALGILNGHNCLVAGTYKYSLGEYMSAFKQDSTNPLVALMLGLTFCHMACQKFSAKKHSLVVQACSFLNTYKELRGECQEVYYNLGRAMHQLSLLPAALFYYKKALDLGPSIKSESPDHNMFDLRREIAYNVSLIYQGSGNMDLARMYVHKYIVV